MRQLKPVSFFVLLFLAAMTATAAESEVKAPPAMPVAVVVETTHTFPDTQEGIDVSHDFVIRNTGRAPLMIKDVQTYCGCTSSSFPKSIPAGGEGIITIKLSTGGYGGKTVTQKADALTNDPRNPIINFTIHCPVERFAESVPSVVNFKGPPGFVLKQQVKIIPGDKYPFKITGSKAREGQYIRFEVKEATVDGRPGYLVDVENTRTEVGSYQDNILLETDNSTQPLLNLRVYGNIIDPSRILKDNPDQSGGDKTPD